jgi:predicted transcriptional regulator
MQIDEITRLVEGRVITGAGSERELFYAFASDLMSDVLTLMEDNVMLITGLANVQAVRTALMSDIGTVLLVRGKRATQEMKDIAANNGLVLIESDYSMFRSAGILYRQGLKAVF